MIQRIQSVWLLLAGIFTFVALRQPFFFGSELGQPAAYFVGSSSLTILVLSVIVGLLAIVPIFLYKDRKAQLWLTLLDLLLSIVVIALYFIETGHLIGTIAWSAIFVFLVPLFLILAARGINKDRKLIKSVDRLRD